MRGYGLADSEKKSAPGRASSVTFNVKAAATPQEAAQIYPSNYWYSLMQVPPRFGIPGTGQGGNGIAPGILTQAHWIDRLKDGCELCHQMGNKATREMPMLEPDEIPLDASPRGSIAFRPGRSGPNMMSALNRLGPKRALDDVCRLVAIGSRAAKCRRRRPGREGRSATSS